MKAKNNYKFPIGGVIAIVSAAVIFAVTLFYTGTSIAAFLRNSEAYREANLISFLLSEAVSGLVYTSIGLALFGFGCLLIFKQRNPSLLFLPVIGILTYLTSGVVVSLSYVIQLIDFNRFSAIAEALYDRIEYVLDGGRLSHLVSFYRTYVHGVYVVPLLSILSSLLIVVAFALFILVILKNRGEKRGGGKLVIISAVAMALGYGVILASNLTINSTYILSLVLSRVAFRSIISEIFKIAISEGSVVPTVMLVSMTLTLLFAGLWIVNPFKKEPAFVEAPEAAPSELPVE